MNPNSKVLVVHGLFDKPNGAWRPWLLGQLAERRIFGFALAMPTPERPVRDEWVAEIARYVDRYKNDEVYLVGHSLGGAAVLRYLESVPAGTKIAGVVLVAASCRVNANPETRNFFETPIDFLKIRPKGIGCVVIHGDNDTTVPYEQGQTISRELGCELVTVEDGGHFSSSEGWKILPHVLEALEKLMK